MVGLPVDLVVHRNHDDPRHPEADAGTDYGVQLVHLEHTHIRIFIPIFQMFLRGVPAGEDRQEAHNYRRTPHDAQHDSQSHVRHDRVVVKRLNDRVISVHADAAEMEDADGAEENVQGVPHVAHKVTEQPASGKFHGGVERHREQSYQHIRQRQRHHEIVRDHLELPMPHDRDDDQQIAEERADDDKSHDESLDG